MPQTVSKTYFPEKYAPQVYMYTWHINVSLIVRINTNKYDIYMFSNVNSFVIFIIYAKHILTENFNFY